MRKIPRSLEEKILRTLLGGISYRATAEKYNVSLATLHRIVEDARKRAPDFDKLRQISTNLKKLDLTPFDVMRALPVIAKLEELNVGIEELPSFVKVTTQLTKGNSAETVELVHAMQELVKLEDQTGKSYEELAKDLKNKKAEVNGIVQKVENLQRDKQRLGNKLERERHELQQVIGTKRGLKKLDLDELASLVEFAGKRKTLEKMFQQKGIHLEKEIKRLNMQLERKEKKSRWLNDGIEELGNEMQKLQRKFSKLTKLSVIVEKEMAFVPCKNCGWEGVFLRFPTRSDFMLAQMTGFVWSSRCAHCGHQVQYSYLDILTYVGWLAIP